MTTASFRVTTAWTGKRPGKRITPLDVDTRDDAVLCALQWMVWSHERGRPTKLPRYMTFRVEEREGDGWIVVREGTYADAKAEYGEKDAAASSLSTVQPASLFGRKAGSPARNHQAPRRNLGQSKLARFVNQVLNDI